MDMPRIITLDAYRALPRPRLSWLVWRLIPKPGIMLILGQPKGGKTSLALQLASAIASGTDFMGQRTEAGTVLYVQVDPGELTWRERLNEVAEAGLPLGGRLITVHPDDTPLPLNILLPEGRGWFKQVLDEANPDAVVVDVFREIHGADENESVSMKSVGDALLKTFAGRALILLHHTRKIGADITDPDPSNSSRGSSYLPGRADVIWLIYRNRFKIINRLDEDRVVPATRNDIGLWTFPQAEAYEESIQRVLSLCAERPDLPHARLQKIAQERWSMSRATYYRFLGGRTCAHTQDSSSGS